MKIVMMGSGGVGGFFGAKLVQAGCDVTFVARGAHLAAMRENGLLIESEARGDTHLPKVQATDDPASVGRADLVIISVKLWDTEAAAAQIKPIVGPDTGVLSLQNGVIKDIVLREKFGEKAVMGGVAYVGSHIGRPGVIHQIGTMQRIVVGEYDKRKSTRAQYIYEAFGRAGVTAELSEDIRRSIWEKYAFLVGLSAVTTAMRSTLGPVLANPRSRDFMLQIMQEAVAVGRAHGVDLPADFAENRLAFAHTLPADMDASMHHDLKNGNRIEVDWLSGGVVKLGKEKGVPTPANDAICAVLAIHAMGAKRA